MCHVCLDEVTCGQSGAQTKFTREDSGTDNAGKLACVVTGISGMGATHAKEVKHCRLRLKDSATTDGTNFNGWHRDRDLEVSVETDKMRLVKKSDSISTVERSSHRLTSS